MLTNKTLILVHNVRIITLRGVSADCSQSCGRPAVLIGSWPPPQHGYIKGNRRNRTPLPEMRSKSTRAGSGRSCSGSCGSHGRLSQGGANYFRFSPLLFNRFSPKLGPSPERRGSSCKTLLRRPKWADFWHNFRTSSDFAVLHRAIFGFTHPARRTS